MEHEAAAGKHLLVTRCRAYSNPMSRFHSCNRLSCALSSCEDLLPLDVSCALMAVMCEQLQNLLHTFLQLQAAERETAERAGPDSTSKATNLMGFSGTIFFFFFIEVMPLKSVFQLLFFSFCAVSGVESSKAVESQLADFLVFLRRVLSLRVMKRLSTFVKWIDPLMAIISHKCSLGQMI